MKSITGRHPSVYSGIHHWKGDGKNLHKKVLGETLQVKFHLFVLLFLCKTGAASSDQQKCVHLKGLLTSLLDPRILDCGIRVKYLVDQSKRSFIFTTFYFSSLQPGCTKVAVSEVGHTF